MNIYQSTAPNCLLLCQSIDYAGAGLRWSAGFNCYVHRMGGGDYWLCAYPSPGYGQPGEVFLTCDEDVLMRANLKEQAGLTRAIAKAQRLIDTRVAMAEAEDMDNLTESLGMGRMFGTMAFA